MGLANEVQDWRARATPVINTDEGGALNRSVPRGGQTSTGSFYLQRGGWQNTFWRQTEWFPLRNCANGHWCGAPTANGIGMPSTSAKVRKGTVSVGSKACP